MKRAIALALLLLSTVAALPQAKPDLLVIVTRLDYSTLNYCAVHFQAFNVSTHDVDLNANSLSVLDRSGRTLSSTSVGNFADVTLPPGTSVGGYPQFPLSHGFSKLQGTLQFKDRDKTLYQCPLQEKMSNYGPFDRLDRKFQAHIVERLRTDPYALWWGKT